MVLYGKTLQIEKNPIVLYSLLHLSKHITNFGTYASEKKHHHKNPPKLYHMNILAFMQNKTYNWHIMFIESQVPIAINKSKLLFKI